MDNDKAKLFVGGISRETSEEALKAHFAKYGTVLTSHVAKDKNTRSPRGFGFVTFSDPTFADKALQDSHVILGRTVEVKKAIPKTVQLQLQQLQQQQSPNQQKSSGFSENSSNSNGNDYFTAKKIFVGGLSSSLTEEQFQNYFQSFGKIVDVVVMQDSLTNRPRGFGFVTFDSEESVEKVMLNSFHELNGRLVEVKRAVPKECISGSNSNHITKGGVRGLSTKTSQPGSYVPYGPGYEILPGYVPPPGYSGVGGYICGTGFFGGYPMVGYGRPDIGFTPVTPRSPWNGPVLIGATICPSPYNNGCLYPAYVNGGVMMVSGYNENDGPNGNGKLNEVFGGNEQLPSNATLPPIEGIKLGDDSSGLNGSDGGASI
ncbi:hypothetical protein P3X46_021140 [Hevea brasiliensis]|uniref:RRM domain-containing protein n=1 Tax=Hevea brasiliensis TaxID=3981 RepID=A0ABQ9LGH7_HEVBR|nr:RNA-binding protein 1 [Hevea brasiliensis]XP_021687244.2 RNA-binding protein 1 [Hevea brasiliensis]KAJ9166370.1 hypothetical protein P3X46_021140 [Hevea brasiliensis]